ncbi:hypothetical protein [Streptomyces sp. PD-S100-1]|uniref:hypothetical protein n=1 Tax=Streptomyces sp. PD-S100-1 TaxID=3394351 RepID=UPI0039BCB305
MGRPKSEHGETPKRNIRVPDELWNLAKAAAKQEGRTVTDVVNAALTQYVAAQRAKQRVKRHITINETIAALLKQHIADHPGGSALPAKAVSLRTFIPAGVDMVLLDSSEVSRFLRALSGSYRSPVSQDLQQLADALDMQAVTALDAARGNGE